LADDPAVVVVVVVHAHIDAAANTTIDPASRRSEHAGADEERRNT
jgi:hypothetical protein